MYSNNCKVYTAVILNFFLSIQCRRNEEKSEHKTIEVDGKLYKIYSMKKSWLEAILECEDRDSDVAEINSIGQVKALARAMLKHRPAIESVWISGLKESMDGLSREETTKLTSNRDKLECLFLDCHFDGFAIMKSSCNRRRYVVCQNKSSLHESQVSSTTIRINISMPLPSLQKNKLNILVNSRSFSNNNSNTTYNYQTSVSSLQSTTLLSKAETYILSTTKLPALDSTEPRIKSVTYTLLKKNNLKKNSKPAKHQVKYSNVPKLYYAFEGPLVGKLEDNEMNSDQSINKKKLIHKYQKYISIRA